MNFCHLVLPLGLALASSVVSANPNAPLPPASYDAALAKRVGADERGMRPYVLVILKSGPKRVPEGPKRDAMFKGHFANMDRLVREGKLVLAGPFTKDPDKWRGLFLLAVKDIEEAKRITATDPTIVAGEMVAEFHNWYGSAGAMMLPELHDKVMPPQKLAQP